MVYHIDHGSKFNEQLEQGRFPLQDWLPVWFLPSVLKRKALSLYGMALTALGYRQQYLQRGIPTLHFNEYQKLCREMVAGKRPCVLNDEDWGGGQETFEEHVINRAEWDGGAER